MFLIAKENLLIVKGFRFDSCIETRELGTDNIFLVALPHACHNTRVKGM